MNEQLRFATLFHVWTYAMTTCRVLAHHFGMSTAATAQLLNDLVGERLLAEHELTPDESYFHLRPKAAEVLRVAKVSGEPLLGTRKMIAYGTLHFCCLSKLYRPKIPNEVFPKRFPQLFQQRTGGELNLNYCTEADRLLFVRVEHPDSVPGNDIRIIQRARKDVGQRTFGNKGPGLEAFRDLVDERRFAIALLTPFQSRADRIAGLIAREQELFDNYHAHFECKKQGKRTPPHQFIDFATWHRRDKHRMPPLPPPPLEVHVIPDLLHLVYPGFRDKSPAKQKASKKRKKKPKKKPTKRRPPSSVRKVAKQFDFRDQHGPFDIIGDVHGCCEELQLLLEKLGYQREDRKDVGPGWKTVLYVPPPGRTAIFVGNIVGDGPKIHDAISLVRNMVASSGALCVLGDREFQLLDYLRGLNTKSRPESLQATLLSIGRVSNADRQDFRNELLAFVSKLPFHLVLDNARLVVAHAGLPEALHGRNSKQSRCFAIDGSDDLTWASVYRGEALVAYGHTRIEEPSWLNNTIGINTSCVTGGQLTALRYPERELVMVPAKRMYCEAIRS